MSDASDQNHRHIIFNHIDDLRISGEESSDRFHYSSSYQSSDYDSSMSNLFSVSDDSEEEKAIDPNWDDDNDDNWHEELLAKLTGVNFLSGQTTFPSFE